MPEPSAAALRTRLTTCRAALRRRLGRRDPDAGFVLLEEIVSITLLIIIMGALATFFLSATQSTTYERSRQSAIQMANTDLDAIRAVHPTDVALGRPNATAQFTAAPGVVQPALATMDAINDTTTSTQTVTTPTARTANNVPFTVTDYLGQCWVAASTPSGTACTNTASAKASGIAYVRAVVAVTWSGRRCPGGLCSYVTASLISNTPDPQFLLAQPPPNPPLVHDPGPQTYEPGDAVAADCTAKECLQLTLEPTYGVAPATWAVSSGTLPPGLTLSSSGLISGTPTAVAATTTYTFSVTATDAFIRTSPAQSITWTYYPALVITNPGPQTSTVGTAIAPLTLTASGGSGGPYTWADQTKPTLPDGLVISTSGVVSGTPTKAGYGPNQPVTLTATDGTGHLRPVSFTWTVTYPPIAVTQADQINTVNAAIPPLQLKATGGSGSFTWTSTTLPTGLTVSSAGVVTGTPTVLKSSPGTTVTVTATDTVTTLTRTTTFVWSVVAPPTVTMTTPVTVQAGVVLTGQTAAFTCPTSSCTFALTGAPAGIGLSTTAGGAAAASVTVTTASGSLFIVGTPGASTAGNYTLKIVPTDQVSGVAGTAGTAAWKVSPPVPPTITGLTTPLVTTVGATVNQTLPYTCASTSCTYNVTGAAAGTGLSATSGGAPQTSVTVTGSASGNLYLTGTVAASAGPPGTATADVTAAGASNFWRLGEASGTTGADSIGTTPLLEQAGVTHGVPGAIVTSSDGASGFDGQASDGMAVTQTAVAGPQVFSTSLWFQTTTTSGGRLFGFGTSKTGSPLSNNYDRQTYLDNAGHVYFGVCGTTCPTTISTPGTYNDGNWHQVVGTLSSAGTSLYVDGALVGTLPGSITAQVIPTGYWRLGGDNLGGWPGTITSSYYKGALDDVAVYPSALTAAQVARQWSDGNGAPYTVTASSVDNTSGVVGTSTQAAWTVMPPPAVGGVTTLATTVGSTVSQPLAYTCPTSSCSFAVSGAPAGVGLRTGTTGTLYTAITVTDQNGLLYLAGTATPAGTYTVTVTPTDTPSGVVGTTSQATWTVRAAPTITGLPASYALSVGSPVSVPLTYTCPSSSCTFTYTGNPAALPGIGLSTSTTAAIGTSLTVANASGTLYLRGTVGATATGTYIVTVTPVDVPSGNAGPVNQTTGTVVGAPTVTPPATVTAGSSKSTSTAFTYSCPLGSCTLTLANSPSGVGLATTPNSASGTNATTSLTLPTGSGTLYLQGKTPFFIVPSTRTLTFTITDSAQSTATSTTTLVLQ